MEEKCLSATVELYKEVGKLDQLGEDQCPERLRVWLKKSRADAMEYEKEARKVYRFQVSRIAHIMATTPTENAFVFYCYKSINVLHKQWNAKRSTFSKKYKVYGDVRNHHDHSLRPELGSFNHAQELAKLNQAESERAAEVGMLIRSTRQVLLMLCDRHAEVFGKDLCHRSES
jgi:hypothetical protein